MFSEESLGKINLKLFRIESVHGFYRLKALITLEQVHTTETWHSDPRSVTQTLQKSQGVLPEKLGGDVWHAS